MSNDIKILEGICCDLCVLDGDNRCPVTRIINNWSGKRDFCSQFINDKDEPIFDLIVTSTITKVQSRLEIKELKASPPSIAMEIIAIKDSLQEDCSKCMLDVDNCDEIKRKLTDAGLPDCSDGYDYVYQLGDKV